MAQIQTQRQMLEVLVKDVSHIKKEQGGMKTKQDDMDLRLNTIEVELVGTAMDPDKGMVSQVKQNTKCISKLKKERNRTIAIGAAIIAFVNMAGIFIAEMIRKN